LFHENIFKKSLDLPQTSLLEWFNSFTIQYSL